MRTTYGVVAVMIYLGDCMEILKTLPSKSVDLVVTDPPYLQGKSGGGGFGVRRRAYRTEVDNVGEWQIAVLDELERIMKHTNIYIWCSKAQIGMLFNYYEAKGCNCDLLMWHKKNPVPACANKYISDTEYCVFARAKGVGLYGSPRTKHKYWITSTNKADKKKYLHPTIKPLHIIENLVFNSSKEGEVVLDPYMGTGTTGVACRELNRQFIGIEINEQWFDIAQQRLNEPKQMEII